VDPADDKVYGRLGSIRKRLAGLSALFSDESYVAVVLNPDQLSVSEALRIKEELDRIDVPLSSLCVNKRGVSAAAWSLDRRLSGSPAFDFNFLPEGLREREDLLTIDTSGLVDDFLASGPKGST
jgi:anion-transporting  ArsA/GET3 family ATPase